MSDSKGPVIIDADAFDPTPVNVFKYRGETYPAFHYAQLRGDVQEKVGRVDEHLKALKSKAAITAFLVEVIQHFVPAAPGVELEKEPTEKLYRCVVGLILPEGSGTERPTTGQRKSASRRSTRR